MLHEIKICFCISKRSGAVQCGWCVCESEKSTGKNFSAENQQYELHSRSSVFHSVALSPSQSLHCCSYSTFKIIASVNATNKLINVCSMSGCIRTLNSQENTLNCHTYVSFIILNKMHTCLSACLSD